MLLEGFTAFASEDECGVVVIRRVVPDEEHKLLVQHEHEGTGCALIVAELSSSAHGMQWFPHKAANLDLCPVAALEEAIHHAVEVAAVVMSTPSCLDAVSRKGGRERLKSYVHTIMLLVGSRKSPATYLIVALRTPASNSSLLGAWSSARPL